MCARCLQAARHLAGHGAGRAGQPRTTCRWRRAVRVPEAVQRLLLPGPQHRLLPLARQDRRALHHRHPDDRRGAALPVQRPLGRVRRGDGLLQGECRGASNVGRPCAVWVPVDKGPSFAFSAQNCSANAGGPACDRCAEGHYGHPDAPQGCRACPCPSERRNFASSCEVAAGAAVCHCREGYEGAKCERCAPGWFGQPLRPGGSCQPCMCDPLGSAADSCDAVGQCTCLPGKQCV